MFTDRSASISAIITIVLALTIVVRPGSAISEDAIGDGGIGEAAVQEGANELADRDCDRIWVISTRGITTEICRANLDSPSFSVSRLTCNGHSSPATLDHYIESIGSGRHAVIYVHGNRLDGGEAISRALKVYRLTRRHAKRDPIDWVIYSWPSEKEGLLVTDFRRKAVRTDTQGLYLSWLLRRHAESNVPTTLIGYSFGARVVTGALHAMAGGHLGGRRLSGEPVTGHPFDAGLVAPALESDWMARGGQHALATKNLDRLLLLYNRRDAVLKRYWLLDKVRGAMALGYSGPTSFARRFDGSKLPVRARDCSLSVGRHHSELDYYEKSRAGSEMSALIDDIHFTP